MHTLNPILQRLVDLGEGPQDTEGGRSSSVPHANGDNIARIVFKDEGWDDEGRSRGPAYAENDKGDLVINYGWITRQDAERLSVALGVEFIDA